jgi:hypothetical protein
VTAPFTKPSSDNTTPTYDYLAREFRDGAYNPSASRGYTSGIVGSSGITSGITNTYNSNNNYTSTIAPSLSSYDTLRTNFTGNQFGTSVPEYITETTVETIPVEGGVGIVTTTT